MKRGGTKGGVDAKYPPHPRPLSSPGEGGSKLKINLMEQITLNAAKRTLAGKKAQALFKQGKLPAVLYGHNIANQSIELNEKDFFKVFKKAGESTIVNLVVDGTIQPVLIHDVQRHYLLDHPIHVDFYAVNMSEKLRAKIPLHFIGESNAVKALGGMLVKNLQEVEVECLPADLPHAIEVDISKLNNFEDAIRVSDLSVSNKVKILASPDEVMVTTQPPRSEEELKELEQAPVAEDVTKVEGVIKPEAIPGGKEEGLDAKAEPKVE